MGERVFVTGGSGFVGQAVLAELLRRGYGVNALVHRRAIEMAGDVRSIRGSLDDVESLAAAMEGCSAVVHLVGIIEEAPSKGVTFERVHAAGTERVVEAAVRRGVQRFVHMSALGTRPGAASRYHQTKWRAEESVRHSGLQWTILRPSMIHGPKGEFMRMEAAWARGKAAPFLFMPYFGRGPLGTGGAGRLQPVYVEEVARAFVDAFEKPATVGKTYCVAGRDRLTWPELHRTSARHIAGRRRPVLAIPAWKANLLTRVVPASLLPFNRDQVVMSQEDNTCETAEFERDFGWSPRGFEETLRGYAGEI